MAKAKKQTDGAKPPKTLRRLTKAKVQGESVLDSMTEEEKGQFNADYVQQVLEDRYRADSETASGREPAQDAKPIDGAKTLAEMFLEIPIGPPHSAFPTSLLPEGAGFESLGAPTTPNQKAPTKDANSIQGDPNTTTTKTKYPWDTDGERKSEEPTTKTDDNPTTQIETDDSGKGEGDEILVAAATLASYGLKSLESLPFARARDGETKGQCRERLRQEARTAGMTRRDAISYAGRMVEQVWIAPVEPELIEELVEATTDPDPAQPEPAAPTTVDKLDEPSAPTTVDKPPADQGVSGLGDLPPDWPQLPANASLQVEIAWVSANRLRVRSGHGVDLSRALSPAPSYSALSWLETSILFPSKFADISVKATASQDDEKEHIRREKLAIEEVRAILAEMLE